MFRREFEELASGFSGKKKKKKERSLQKRYKEPQDSRDLN